MRVDERLRIVDGIEQVRDVIDNRDHRRTLGAECGAGRIAQYDIEGLVAFAEHVFVDEQREGLAGFARSEVQRPRGILEISLLRGAAIGRGVINCSRAAGVTTAGDGYSQRVRAPQPHYKSPG